MTPVDLVSTTRSGNGAEIWRLEPLALAPGDVSSV